MFMKQFEQDYHAPDMEVDLIIVERGFIGSNGPWSNMENIGEMQEDGEW